MQYSEFITYRVGSKSSMQRVMRQLSVTYFFISLFNFNDIFIPYQKREKCHESNNQNTIRNSFHGLFLSVHYLLLTWYVLQRSVHNYSTMSSHNILIFNWIGNGDLNLYFLLEIDFQFFLDVNNRETVILIFYEWYSNVVDLRSFKTLYSISYLATARCSLLSY